jgi:hypothetical protein
MLERSIDWSIDRLPFHERQSDCARRLASANLSHLWILRSHHRVLVLRGDEKLILLIVQRNSNNHTKFVVVISNWKFFQGYSDLLCGIVRHKSECPWRNIVTCT